MIRHALIALLCLPALAAAQAPALPAKNLVYEDGFVWYLAGRLTAEQMALQKLSGERLAEREQAEMAMHVQFLYHHALISCDGPLAKIAPSFAMFDLSETRTAAQTLAFAGEVDRDYWPIIRAWNARAMLPLMATLAKGDFGPLPKCIDKGYLAQNQIPGVNAP